MADMIQTPISVTIKDTVNQEIEKTQTDVLIKVEKISKKFCRNLKRSMIYGMQDLAYGLIGKKKDSLELRKDEFWALDNINFELKKGDVLGIIGSNGSGKSTLLRVLSGIFPPDKGVVKIFGSVGGMIALGAGMHPHMTGRENIYLNGTILGLSKSEIDEKYDSIVEFADLGDFLEAPLSTYSSGMKIRLGFAVAAQIKPDILLIDEVLAVGDIGFAMKSLNHIDKIIPESCVIFISHNMPMVARICNQVMVLKEGQIIKHTDDVAEGIAEYYNQFDVKVGDYTRSNEAELNSIRLFSADKEINSKDIIDNVEGIVVELDVSFYETFYEPDIALSIFDKEQRNFAEIFNFKENVTIVAANGRYIFRAQFPELPLNQGIFSFTVRLMAKDNTGARRVIFRRQSAIYFNVKSRFTGWAPVQLIPKWTHEMVSE